jgi:rubrerythrin
MTVTATTTLARLLQLAYSAELGAALAYTDHAASVTDPTERQQITQIRDEELDHRERLGRMLHTLAARPSTALELRNRALGAAIGRFCHVGGWFFPMYGAGWLESRNIADYERTAHLALVCDYHQLVDDLLDMAEMEWEHERYFRLKAEAHPFATVFPLWKAPAPKATIRARFAALCEELHSHRCDRGVKLREALIADERRGHTQAGAVSTRRRHVREWIKSKTEKIRSQQTGSPVPTPTIRGLRIHPTQSYWVVSPGAWPTRLPWKLATQLMSSGRRHSPPRVRRRSTYLSAPRSM